MPSRGSRAFLGRSPDTATPEELRAFQLHLTETGLQPQSINATVTALRFFFKVTLDRPETTRRLVFVYEPRKLPRVLSPEEVLRLLEAAPGPKHKAALSVAYGAGLRAMEVVALKVCDIDSKRMMLRVEQGKGHKDRQAMLSPTLLELLRDWWRIHAKRPFAGPKAVLAYLSRYTHRVAISNSRLIAVDQHSVTFKVKDYRIEGPGRYTTMTLDAGEFIRRFLIHVLPKGFHRIRHYGLFASANRAETIARARELLGLAAPVAEEKVEIDPAAAQVLAQPCPCCGGRMFVIEIFDAGCQPRHRPTAMGFDTS